MGAALWASPAFAADPPPDAPPPSPPPAVDAPPPAAPPAAVAADKTPPTAVEAMPATRPEVLPPIAVGAWLRAGSFFQKGPGWGMDTAYGELHAGGKIHKKVGVTLNLAANMVNWTTPAVGNATMLAIMDAIVQFDLADEFHLWAGRLLVPVDRSNASGPFFMIPWNYPGFIAGAPVSAPIEGPLGRNNGAVVWGDLLGGKFTYLAGVFDNANAAGTSPLFSGRVKYCFLDAEGGFWGNGSFFGEKDILTLGVGSQFMAHGSTSMPPGAAAPVDKDWVDINADLLFEKKIPGGSWVTAEAAYYHYSVNDGSISDTGYLLGAWASPIVGVGNIQPSARVQFAKVKGTGGSTFWDVAPQVSYLVKGPALRVNVTYTHTDLDALGSVNTFQLGAQAIFF
jgi:hypothetical protein